MLLLLPGVLLLAGCGDNNDTKQQPDPESHTMLMYLIANNDLKAALKNNINAVMEGVGVDFPENCSIFVYLDDDTEKTLYKIERPDRSGAWGSKKKVKEYSHQSAVDPEVMKTVIGDVTMLAPAEHYGIVLGSHAMGWFPPNMDPRYQQRSIGGYASDVYSEHDFRKPEGGMLTRYFGDDNGAKMSIADIKEGLSGQHFDYILFDACFMSSIEALWDLRSSADYIISSPAEIMGAGFPYAKIVPALFVKGGIDMQARLSESCRLFIDHYLNDLNVGQRSAAITLVKTDKLHAFAQSVKAIFEGDIKDYDISAIQAYEKMNNKAFFDLYDYMFNICDDTGLFAGFEQAFSDAIVYEGHTPTLYGNVGGSGTFPTTRASGIATYIPRDNLPIFKAAYYNTDWSAYTPAQ